MLERLPTLYFLRHDVKWVPRPHMYKMILKFKKLRKIVLKNNTKNGKRGSKRDSPCAGSPDRDSGLAPDHRSIRNKEV